MFFYPNMLDRDFMNFRLLYLTHMFYIQVADYDSMLVLVLSLLYGVADLVSSQTYAFNANSSIQNVIYDDSSKRVFVGATNQIFRLSVSMTQNSYVKYVNVVLILYHLLFRTN